jgi:hypothetical protein
MDTSRNMEGVGENHKTDTKQDEELSGENFGAPGIANQDPFTPRLRHN